MRIDYSPVQTVYRQYSKAVRIDSVSLSRGRSLPGSQATRPVCHSKRYACVCRSCDSCWRLYAPDCEGRARDVVLPFTVEEVVADLDYAYACTEDAVRTALGRIGRFCRGQGVDDEESGDEGSGDEYFIKINFGEDDGFE